ncbi:MAG: LUD domain-containing protein [Phycisphaeraceae bacterium]|nr:LUD domain-containing protein [Phycisphaeraceae bacterium]
MSSETDNLQSMLTRIRAALGPPEGRTDAPPLLPGVDEAVMRISSADADLPGLFTRRATKLGMTVHRCQQQQVTQIVLEILQSRQSRRIANASAHLDSAALTAAGHECLDWRTCDPFTLDAGISDADGLAESGSLICRAGPDQSRAISLVPPLHIALLRQQDIAPDLLDCWPSPLPGELPSSLSIISGPSKTADIEGQLVKGVHGPAAVEIVLIA